MINKGIILELQHEGTQTRRMLERVPFDKFDWKPHGKSMTLGRLSVHVAELPGWVPQIVRDTHLDLLQRKYGPTPVQSNEELVALSDRKLQEAVEALSGAGDEILMQPWTLNRGEHVVFTMPRVSVIRTMAMNHIIHHRAQISVFLRLLDVAVPGMYGPSADEM